MKLDGLRIAIAGMGRSGVGIATAAVQRGAHSTVFDELSADTPERLATIEHLEGLGVEVITGWHGHLIGYELDMLVASPGFRRDHPAIRDALQMNCPVVSEVEFAYRIAQAPIIGITGTNGKSTVTAMTYHLLHSVGESAILCGNISGSGYEERTLTEAAHASNGEQVLVAEISSYQLEWIHEFCPWIATITNITPDHLDRHPTFQDYFDTKLRIFANLGTDEIIVANASSESVSLEVVRAAAKGNPKIALFGIGSGSQGDWTAAFDPDSMTIFCGDHSLPIQEMQVVGTHNGINAAHAMSLAVSWFELKGRSAPVQALLDSLKSFRPLQHRMERLGSKHGVTIVNNSMCTNPGAVVASSQALPHRQWLLLGGERKGLDFAPVREYLDQSGHHPVLFSPLWRELAAQLGKDVPGFETLESAFAYCVENAQDGEIVMLAPGCASAFPYPNFRDRGEAFRAMAAKWLNS